MVNLHLSIEELEKQLERLESFGSEAYSDNHGYTRTHRYAKCGCSISTGSVSHIEGCIGKTLRQALAVAKEERSHRWRLEKEARDRATVWAGWGKR